MHLNGISKVQIVDVNKAECLVKRGFDVPDRTTMRMVFEDYNQKGGTIMKSMVRFGVQVCASLLVCLFLTVSVPVKSFSSYCSGDSVAMWLYSSEETTVNIYMDGF
jgi:hypothetical protein